MAPERQALKLSHETGLLIEHFNTSCHVVTLLIGIHCQKEDRMLESIRPMVQLRCGSESVWRISSRACVFNIYHLILTS